MPTGDTHTCPTRRADGFTTYDELRDVIRAALDRDGQHEWDETDRLANEIAPTVWNHVTMFPLVAPTTLPGGWDDPHRLCGDVCIADRIVVGRVPPFEDAT